MEYMSLSSAISAENFGFRIADRLLPGSTIRYGCHSFRGRDRDDQPNLMSLVVAGQYDFGGDVGVCNIDIVVPEPSAAWLNYPPIVIVHEPWLSPVFPEQEQSYANWHRYPSGEICWITPTSWIKHCKSIVELDGIEHVIQQMFKDIDFVLSCHMVAYCYRLRKWSHLWPSAPHGYQD